MTRAASTGDLATEPSLVFTNTIAHIYYLDDIAAGYCVWSGFPRLEPTREALRAGELLLRSRGAHRWISDTKDVLVAPPDTQAHITDWLKRLRDLHILLSWADVPPRSAVARLTVRNLGAESKSVGVRFAQFADLESAKAWSVTT